MPANREERRKQRAELLTSDSAFLTLDPNINLSELPEHTAQRVELLMQYLSRSLPNPMRVRDIDISK